MAHFPNPADANDVKIPTFAPTPERKILDELQLPLAVGRVRFVGEAVAVAVAAQRPTGKSICRCRLISKINSDQTTARRPCRLLRLSLRR